MMSFLVIIVVYKRLPAQSPSLQTLLEAVRASSSPTLRLKILVSDNTPGGQDPGELPDQVVYHSAPDNPGLAKPYNDALALAEREGFTWLLTLDQDTHLPANFLVLLEKYAMLNEAITEVAAIVPQIADRGRVISPFRYLWGFLPWISSQGTKGISKRFTSALNSASLLRVKALRQFGGYDTRFPLHHSDTRLYQLLDEAGMRVFIARDILVVHELAILNREDRMTADRYRKLLVDECDFWDQHMGVLGRTERLVRLMGRVCKGYLQNEDAVFRRITFEEIMRRIRIPRRARMRASADAFGSR